MNSDAGLGRWGASAMTKIETFFYQKKADQPETFRKLLRSECHGYSGGPGPHGLGLGRAAGVGSAPFKFTVAAQFLVKNFPSPARPGLARA